jgi:hypothetical protein
MNRLRYNWPLYLMLGGGLACWLFVVVVLLAIETGLCVCAWAG